MLSVRIEAGSDAYLLTRMGLALLPLATLVAGLVLLVVAPLSWGTAVAAELPDWFPPFLGMWAGVTALTVSAMTLRAIWRKTSYSFHLNPLLALAGVATFPSTAFILALLGANLISASTFEGALGGRGRPEASPAFISMVGLFGTGAVLAMHAAGAALYAGAVEVVLRKYQRDDDEVDTVGMLMRGEWPQT
jgi:hypothetical protein